MNGQREKVITTNIINTIAGLWLVLFPFFFGFMGTAFAVNAYIVGIIIAVLSLIRVFSPEETEWASWTNVIVGLWLIISAFLLGGMMATALWNNFIVGLVVIVFGLWSTMSSASRSHPRMG